MASRAIVAVFIALAAASGVHAAALPESGAVREASGASPGASAWIYEGNQYFYRE